MLPTQLPLAAKRAELARAARKAKSDPASTGDLHRVQAEYTAAKLADHIQRVVAQAPPLTAEQRLQLAAMLIPPSEAGE